MIPKPVEISREGLCPAVHATFEVSKGIGRLGCVLYWENVESISHPAYTLQVLILLVNTPLLATPCVKVPGIGPVMVCWAIGKRFNHSHITHPN